MKLRSLLAVALLTPALALAAPRSGTAARSAAAPTSSGSPLDGASVGGFVGYETSDFSGLGLRLDGEVPFRTLTQPGASVPVNLSWVGSLGYSRLSWDYAPGLSATVNVFKLVPAARFTLPLNQQFDVFGDFGLGLAHISMDVKYDYGFGTATASASSTNLMMRLGAGAWYKVNPQVRVGAMLEFDPIFGDFGTSGYGMGSENTFSVLVGMMYRL